MSFFVVLLFGFVLGDLLWWLMTHRRFGRRATRVAAAVWAVAMLGGLGLIIGSRFVGVQWDEAMPRPILSGVFMWHLLVLPPWLIWSLARGLVWTARALAHLESKPPADGMSRREFFATSAAFAPAVIVGGASIAAEGQLEEYRVRRLSVPVTGLPAALEGVTIAQVTDTHIGRFTRGAVLDRIVRTTNELEADLVLMTGDLINYALRDLPAGVDLVRELHGKHGVFLCEGNHDLIEDPAAFHRQMLRSGLPFLRGEAAVTEINGAKLQILGLPWEHSDQGHAKAVAALDSVRRADAFPILLAHHPHAFDTAANYPLMLAGHTHGGQLMLNDQIGFGPLFFRYWSGLYRREGRTLVVSNGVGNWFPVRIGAPAEILHLTLRRA
jgi:predicted MPP superfamily phosphohydrolase